MDTRRQEQLNFIINASYTYKSLRIRCLPVAACVLLPRRFTKRCRSRRNFEQIEYHVSHAPIGKRKQLY